MTRPLWLLQAPDGLLQALRQLLGRLLAGGLVDDVMVQVAQPGDGPLSLALVNDAELLSRAHPIAPQMAVNAARMVSRLTSTAPARRIAVVLRPCEERAVVELVKLRQATLENVIPVVVDCPGACDRHEAARLSAGPHGRDGATDALIAAAYEPEAPGPTLRPACDSCDAFVPGPLAAVAVEIFGHKGDAGLRFSDELAEGWDLASLGIALAAEPPAAREKIVEGLAEKRRGHRARELEKVARLSDDVSALLEEVGACIRCGACRQACPICFCKRCTFEMPVHEHEPEDFLRWASRKGASRLPEDVLLYHLTRLAHVGLSCTFCGSCESACPQGVRLARLFAHVAPRLREPFGYHPGRSVDEPLPLSVFEKEELEPR